jgi:hypothetical protein
VLALRFLRLRAAGTPCAALRPGGPGLRPPGRGGGQDHERQAEDSGRDHGQARPLHARTAGAFGRRCCLRPGEHRHQPRFGSIDPASLPQPAQRLHEALNEALAPTPRSASWLAEPSPASRQQFAAFVGSELVKSRTVVQATGAMLIDASSCFPIDEVFKPH